jgi:alpha-D-ribose 1-methylphosphonate 5-phosphate C-P lyase
MTLDCYTYDVVRAVEIPVETVKTLAREIPWVSGHRVNVSQITGPVRGASDITGLIRRTLDDLGE